MRRFMVHKPNCTSDHDHKSYTEGPKRTLGDMIAVDDSFPHCWANFVKRLVAEPNRPKLVVSSVLPHEPHLMVARPEKPDWYEWMDAAVAHRWLAAQRAFFSSGVVRAADSTGPRPVMADLGKLVAQNRGVRCDGIHFETDRHQGFGDWCVSSIGAWDSTIRHAILQHCKAAEDAGVVGRVANGRRPHAASDEMSGRHG